MDRIEGPAAPRPLWGRALAWLARLAVALAAIYLTLRLASAVGWAAIADAIAGARPWPLFGAALLLLLRQLLWSQRWRLAMGAAALRCRSPAAFFILAASMLINLVTPSLRVLGGVARARYAATATATRVPAQFGVVLFDQSIHHLVMSVLTWLTLALVLWSLGQRRLAAAAIAGFIGVGIALWTWSRRRQPGGPHPLLRFLAGRTERRASWSGSLYRHGQEAASTFLRLWSADRLAWWSVGLTLAFFVASGAAQWLIFAGLDRQVALATCLGAVALGNAAGLVTGTPGGIGTTEAAMVGCFVALGADRLDALAATVLFRGLHYALVVALGLPALLVFELRPRRRPR